MKIDFKFIKIFIIIGLESLGNMSAVTAVLEENLVRRNKLVNQEDIIDAVTFARLGPGATTANAVAFLGNKIAGIPGGIISTICYTIGPLIVMLSIYGVIEQVAEYEFIKSAMKGSLIYISLIFCKSILGMGKLVLNEKFNIIVFAVALIAVLVFKLSCIVVILAAIVIRNSKNIN